MITGIVTVAREAVINLTVRGPNGQEQEIEAVIDTGFDGSLTLPPTLIIALGYRGAGVGEHPWRMATRTCLIFTRRQ